MMKTIYSLNEFYDDVAALAAQKGQDHVMVQIQRSKGEPLEFNCYFHGCKKLYKGETPGEAMANLRKAEFPELTSRDKVDVEVESEIEPAQC